MRVCFLCAQLGPNASCERHGLLWLGDEDICAGSVLLNALIEAPELEFLDLGKTKVRPCA